MHYSPIDLGGEKRQLVQGAQNMQLDAPTSIEMTKGPPAVRYTTCGLQGLEPAGFRV